MYSSLVDEAARDHRTQLIVQADARSLAKQARDARPRPVRAGRPSRPSRLSLTSRTWARGHHPIVAFHSWLAAGQL